MVSYGMVWYVCMYLCIYVCIYICICMYMYVDIHTSLSLYIIYTCTHIYTSWNSFRKCFATPGRPPQWELTCHEKLEEDLQKLGRQPRKWWWMMVSCDWSWLVMGYFMDFHGIFHGFSWIFHGFSWIFHGFSWDISWIFMDFHGYFMDFHGIFHGFSWIFMGYLMILCLIYGGFWSPGSPSHLGFNAKSPKVIRMTTGWELGVTPMTLETSLTDL